MSFKQICNAGYIPALDGLRALSVLTVFVYHFGFDSIPGDLGVSTFFAISGFLITWLLLREQETVGGISLAGFYARRTIRIFPVYYVFLAVIYLEERMRGYEWPSGLLAAGLLYVVNYFNAINGHPASSSISHAWSLGVEEQFYLLWPLALSFLIRQGRVYCSIGLIVSIGFVVLLRAYLYLVVGVGSSYVYNAFETRFDSLAVGCLIAVANDSPKFDLFASKLARYPFLPFVTMGLLVWSRVGWGDGYHYSAGFTVDSILLGLLLVQLVLLQKDFWWSWLEWPWVRYLGKISYSFYLFHVLGIGIGRHFAIPVLPLQFAASLLLCIGMASASYWLIERPFLELRHRIPERWRWKPAGANSPGGVPLL